MVYPLDSPDMNECHTGYHSDTPDQSSRLSHTDPDQDDFCMEEDAADQEDNVHSDYGDRDQEDIQDEQRGDDISLADKGANTGM